MPDGAAPARIALPDGPGNGSGSSPIGIRMDLEALDTVRAYQLHNRDQLWRKPTLISLAVTLGILGAFLAVAVDDWRAIAAILALALVGGLAVPRLMIRWYVPRVARRIYGQQQNLRQPIEVTFEPGGLRTAAATGTSFTPWPHYRKLREDEHVLLFYQSDALFQFVPKRFLRGSQSETVRRMYHDASARTPPTT